MDSQGKLYVVGVGPGSPDLLTIRAVNILTNAEILLVPSGGAKSEALRVVEPYFRGEVHLLSFPMGMEGEDRVRFLREHAAFIARLVGQGKKVVFAVLGDPVLYSTVFALLPYLPPLPVEIVPGISAHSLAAAKLGWSLGEKEEVVGIVPAGNRELLARLLPFLDAVVVPKVSRDYQGTLVLLREWGFTVGLAVRCGQEEEVITSHPEEYRAEEIGYFSLLLGRRRKG